MAMNMGYCRFENTLAAMRECADALDEEGTAELSDSEKKAAFALIKMCKRISDDYAGLGMDAVLHKYPDAYIRQMPGMRRVAIYNGNPVTHNGHRQCRGFGDTEIEAWEDAAKKLSPNVKVSSSPTTETQTEK